MKKLFLGLGAVVTIITPIVAVVSCGSSKEATSKFLKVNGALLKLEKPEYIEEAMGSYDEFLKIINTIQNFVSDNYGHKIEAIVSDFLKISIEKDEMTIEPLRDTNLWSIKDKQNIAEFYRHFFFQFANSNKGSTIYISNQSYRFAFNDEITDTKANFSIPLNGFSDEVELQNYFQNTSINVRRFNGV